MNLLTGNKKKALEVNQLLKRFLPALIDQVWYVLSPISPFKQKEKILEKNKRANLIEKALLNEEKLILCKQEFNLPIPNYSIDTKY